MPKPSELNTKSKTKVSKVDSPPSSLKLSRSLEIPIKRARRLSDPTRRKKSNKSNDEDINLMDESSFNNSPTRVSYLKRLRMLDQDGKSNSMSAIRSMTPTKSEMSTRVDSDLKSIQEDSSVFPRAFSPPKLKLTLKSSQSSSALSRSLPEEDFLLRSRSTEIQPKNTSPKKDYENSPTSLKIRKKKKKIKQKAESELELSVIDMEPHTPPNSMTLKKEWNQEEWSKPYKLNQTLNLLMQRLSDDVDKLESTCNLLQNQFEYSKQAAQNTGLLITDSSLKVANTMEYLKQSKSNKNVLLSLLSILILIVATIVWLFCAFERAVVGGCMKLYTKMKKSNPEVQRVDTNKTDRESESTTKLEDAGLLEEVEEMKHSIKSFILKDRGSKRQTGS